MKPVVLNKKFSIRDVIQQWQYQQKLLNCKYLHKNRQRLTSSLYCCFLANRLIQSLHIEQTQDSKFIFAQYRKVAGNVDEKVNFVKFWSKSSNF